MSNLIENNSFHPAAKLGHKVEELNDDEAVELFGCNAFRKVRCEDDYLEMSKCFINYARGLLKFWDIFCIGEALMHGLVCWINLWKGICFCVGFGDQKNLSALPEDDYSRFNVYYPNKSSVRIKFWERQASREGSLLEVLHASARILGCHTHRKYYFKFLLEMHWGSIGGSKSFNRCLIVRKCGAHLVSKQDLEELNGTMNILR